jgi:acyl-CoA-dependent ceramide synthase
LFVTVWVYLRHYINLKILWAVLTEFRTVGPFELNWETQQYKCWISQYITFALLASLQAVNLFWLYLIMRILKKYILDDVAQDERSEDEEEEEEANASKAAAGGINEAEGVSSQVSVNGTPTDGRKRK